MALGPDPAEGYDLVAGSTLPLDPERAELIAGHHHPEPIPTPKSGAMKYLGR